MNITLGIIIPLIGTVLGSAMVFFMKNTINKNIEKLLIGLSSGIMIAASIWSLLIPSYEMSKEGITNPYIPPIIGFLIGIIFLFITSKTIKKLTFKKIDNKFKKTLIMVLAITLHNIPEGMAVGVVFSGLLTNNTLITLASAYSLSIGISIQNFPEGSIVSIPLKNNGISKRKSFLYGSLSGIVEPISAIITLLLTSTITKILPYLLSFAAGAMIYVVLYELIPEIKQGKNKYIGILGILLGFLIMMSLDIIF